MTGLFITFEGGEGSGKTTQIKRLHQYFAGSGRKCLLTREPGGTAGGEAIRELLLTGSGDKWDAVAETLLFQAARMDNVQQVIRPALARGEIVLCDRFLDSTLIYQGISKKLGMEYVRQLYRLTLGNFLPDLTLILDIDPETGVKRAKARNGVETRFENMDLEFHTSVRDGFLQLARKEPERCVLIDAGGAEDAVHKLIQNAIVSLAEPDRLTV